MNGPALDHVVARASAGSGKTFRLTNRYIALLADGVPPTQIWAATFTRKAAGEILDRIVGRLVEAASDLEKMKALAVHIDRPEFNQPEFVGLLRNLLAHLHRLRIDTLDSLFLGMVRAFPLALRLPPAWAICDDADAEVARGGALT